MAEQKMAINQAGQVSTVYNKKTSLIECPVCHDMVDMLYGVDEDEGRQGCESCYKPPKTPEKVEVDAVNPNQVDQYDQHNQTSSGAMPTPKVESHTDKTKQLLKSLGV